MLSYACAAWESEPRIVGSNEEAGVSALLAPEPRTSISRAPSVAVGLSRIAGSAPSRLEVGAVGWIRSTDSTTSTSRTLLESRARSFHPEFQVVVPEIFRKERDRYRHRTAVLTNNSAVSSSSEQAPLSTWIRECGTGTTVFPCDHPTDRLEPTDRCTAPLADWSIELTGLGGEIGFQRGDQWRRRW